MADKIQIYAGIKSKMPQLLNRELGYCIDTKELFIGGSEGEGNILLGSVTWGDDIASLIKSKESMQKSISGIEKNIADIEQFLADTEQSIAGIEQELNKKLTASSATSVQELATDAALTDVVSGVNTLINSLKAAGIMET